MAKANKEDYIHTRELIRLIQLYAMGVTIFTCYIGGVIDPSNQSMLKFLQVAINGNIKVEYRKILLEFMLNPSLALGAQLPLLSDMALL